MTMENLIFSRSRWLLLIFLLQYGTCRGDSGRAKRESGLLKNVNIVRVSKSGQLNATQPFIRTRYMEANNSFGGNHAFSFVNSDSRIRTFYRTPQNSYVAPMRSFGQNSGYYAGQQAGYDSNDSSESSPSSIIGLVGLLGLKGLKGTLPFLKRAGIVFVALIPILLPLSLVTFLIIFLKPVVTFGRSLNSECKFNCTKTVFDQITEIPVDPPLFGQAKESTQVKANTELLRFGIEASNQILARQLENKCLERIACEGLLKSIPRIFLRVVGENYPYNKVLRKRRDASKLEENEDITSKSARRKDLATIALNKLKNPQFLTKKQPLIETPEKAEKICSQYKCSLLF